MLASFPGPAQLSVANFFARAQGEPGNEATTMGCSYTQCTCALNELPITSVLSYPIS